MHDARCSGSAISVDQLLLTDCSVVLLLCAIVNAVCTVLLFVEQ